MAVYEVSIAAATAILGYDMFRDEPWTVSAQDRVITGMAVMGSAAAGDAAVDLLIGMVRALRKYNTTTGFPTNDHLEPMEAVIPGGSRLAAPVIDAPATNPLNILITVEDL